jgi:UDP-glucose:(heptosyl)LPS alpha-1,3-glucosyltransferase
MRFALAIVSLFPWGGLQRDCLRLARVLAERGHHTTVLAGRLSGDLPADITIEEVATRGWSNAARNRRFAEAVSERARGFDRIVGFDKLSGLDFLYCADPSVAARVRPLQRLLPRYRELLRLEAACFAPESRTRIIALSETQIAAYRAAWRTPPDRFALLPPGIDPARRRPELRAESARLRATLGLPREATIFLAIASQPHVKGLDRSVAALRNIPAAHLAIVGLNAGDRRAHGLAQVVRASGIGDRVHWLGPREDVPEIMAAADILIHPARTETSGMVILEAIINGLPVVTTAACGFAPHVESADGGIVIPEPFTGAALEAALALAADPERRRGWSARAAAYGADPGLYSGIDRAAAIVEAG